ncbi:MAG: hypothetical protein QW559_03200 [Candidatus Woesearchaeota archaeon]
MALKLSGLTEQIRLVLAEIVLIFIAGLVYMNFFAAVKLAFAFTFLFSLPMALLITLLKGLNFIEKFVLANLFGAAILGIIYFLFDVIFNIPLTTFVFIGTSVVFIAASILLYAIKKS